MALRDAIEAYYDEVPRALTTTEEIGPFTLFVRSDPDGWPYYARPRLGGDSSITVAHVREVTERQRELGQPQSLEWVHETTPGLLPAVRDAGMTVHLCPVLVLDPDSPPPSTRAPFGILVRMLVPGDPELSDTVGAVGAAFSDADEWQSTGPGAWPRLLGDGLTRLAGAADVVGIVGGGSHSPRGGVTELTGIAVIPRARQRGIGAAITALLVDDARGLGVETIFLSAQDDTVARVYERVGFRRVATACIASTSGGG